MSEKNALDYFDKNESTYQEIMEAMQEKPFLEKLKATMEGIGKPKDSGEYKMAKLQLQLWTAPFLSGLAVVTMLVLLLVFGTGKPEEDRPPLAEVLTPETVEDLDEPEPEQEIVPEDVEFVETDFNNPVPNVNVQNPVNQPLSPKPSPVNSVAIVKSPIVMKGMLGSRNPGQIGASRAQYGGSAASEAAVMRALRWLVTKQNSDGSWPNVKPAMTGLALLTFLAHGEFPGQSPEFGPTVQKGIQYLLDTQDAKGFFRGHDGNNYAHLIATYALCEAYSLTKNPTVKEAAEKALVPIVQGQHPNGGWDYKMAQTDRDDTSYMGWASQAIKAGHMAGDLDVPGLEEAYQRAPKGFLKNAHKDGGFGYTGPSANSGLTAVGVLCMQLMGQAKDEHVTKSLKVMDDWVLGWEPDKNDLQTPAIPSKVGAGASQQYYAYYATQAMFQSGGQRWDRWNKMMSDIYHKVQKIQSKETSGYVDNKGQPQEIGHWENGDANEDHGGPFIMDTCLTTLQLEVYYRYLPTFKEVKVEDSEVVLQKDDDVEVGIELF